MPRLFRPVKLHTRQLNVTLPCYNIYPYKMVATTTVARRMTLLSLYWLKVPERMEVKLTILVYRCLYQIAPCISPTNSTSRLMSRPVSVSALLVCFVIIACCLTHPSFNNQWSRLSGRLFLAVEHSAAERHVGAITDCYSSFRTL